MVDEVVVAVFDGVDYLQENTFDGICVTGEHVGTADEMVEVRAIAVVKDDTSVVFEFGDGVQGDDVGVYWEGVVDDGLLTPAGGIRDDLDGESSP